MSKAGPVASANKGCRLVQKEVQQDASPGCYCQFVLLFTARLEGFEPPTIGLEGHCSIRLSYRRNVWVRVLQRVGCRKLPTKHQTRYQLIARLVRNCRSPC